MYTNIVCVCIYILLFKSLYIQKQPYINKIHTFATFENDNVTKPVIILE